MTIFSDDNHHASTSVIYVVQVVSTTHSRTERLRPLLIVSSNCHGLVHTNLIQPLLMSVGLPKK